METTNTKPLTGSEIVLALKKLNFASRFKNTKEVKDFIQKYLLKLLKSNNKLTSRDIEVKEDINLFLSGLKKDLLTEDGYNFLVKHTGNFKSREEYIEFVDRLTNIEIYAKIDINLANLELEDFFAVKKNFKEVYALKKYNIIEIYFLYITGIVLDYILT